LRTLHKIFLLLTVALKINHLNENNFPFFAQKLRTATQQKMLNRPEIGLHLG
jgi:hypothetical protein